MEKMSQMNQNDKNDFITPFEHIRIYAEACIFEI